MSTIVIYYSYSKSEPCTGSLFFGKTFSFLSSLLIALRCGTLCMSHSDCLVPTLGISISVSSDVGGKRGSVFNWSSITKYAHSIRLWHKIVTPLRDVVKCWEVWDKLLKWVTPPLRSDNVVVSTNGQSKLWSMMNSCHLAFRLRVSMKKNITQDCCNCYTTF